MHDEPIKRLRCQRFGNCPNCPMWYTEEVEPNLWRERCAAIDAADAIEKLSAIREEQKAQIILMAAEIEELKTYAELYQSLTDKSQRTARYLLDAYPKWIPVTERLPEEHVFVLIRQEDDRMMVAERVDGDWWYRYFAYDVDRWDENEQGTITHWMPLPEPPEEK